MLKNAYECEPKLRDFLEEEAGEKRLDKSPDLNLNYAARHVIAVLLSVGVDGYL